MSDKIIINISQYNKKRVGKYATGNVSKYAEQMLKIIIMSLK